MKRFWQVVLLLVCSITFIGCSTNTNTNNEIYNKVYDVTLDIGSFEDMVVAVGEKCNKGTIGIANYVSTGLSLSLNAIGSGFIYEGFAILDDQTSCTLEESLTKDNVVRYQYRAITNYHVIEDARVLRVYLGSEYGEVSANQIAMDRKLDLAVITFQTTLYLPPLEFGNSDNVKQGQFVVAIGSPESFEFFNTLTFGVVSAINRIVEEELGKNIYIQTDVAINPGNSGGPLINIEGQVIGVNTMKIVGDDVESLGFSIPINIVKEFIKERL